jgi:hypothetical protein
MVLPLSRPFAARDGAPVLTHVDAGVFTRRYFGACLACTFCRDACCDHGVDVDAATAGRMLAQAEAIEARVGVRREGWFTGPLAPDPDLPGGAATRTRVVDGACVFRSRAGRGCLLHAFAVETGQDYHLLKPMVSALFPLTFADGLLCLSGELEDGSLICAGAGPTAYEAVRDELAYYFGEELVGELDEIGARVQGPGSSRPRDAGADRGRLHPGP